MISFSCFPSLRPLKCGDEGGGMLESCHGRRSDGLGGGTMAHEFESDDLEFENWKEKLISYILYFKMVNKIYFKYFIRYKKEVFWKFIVW